MDRTLDLLIHEFDLGEMDDPVNIYWLSEESLVRRAPCGVLEGARGCFVDGEEAFVVDPSIAEHELVHVYLANRTGRTHAFFEEGIAVVYGRLPSFGPPTSELRDALRHGESLPGEHYARAGHFMSYLLDEYGPETVGRFFREAGGARDLPGIEPVFRDVFSVSLDAFVGKYESQAPMCGSEGWNRPFECELEPLPWRRTWAWDHDFSLECGSEDAVRGYDGRLRTRVALDVEEASTHTLFLEGMPPQGQPDAYSVQILSCGGCEEALSITVDSEMGSLSGIPLPVGRYYVDVSRAPEAVPDVSVLLRAP